MTALKIFEKFLADGYAISLAPTEKDFYGLWHARGIENLPPCEMAVAGALLADRLPWAFTAGYQATLRHSFPRLPRGGWAAFIATEDPKEPERYPGTTLSDAEDGYVLNGYKLWVAHSELLNHLIVTVNDPDGDKRGARGVIFERSRTGVEITQRSSRGFLAAMSQGFARFSDTPIARTEVFDFEAIRQFGRNEAKFVMLSATTFMLARLEEGSELQDRLLSLAAAFVTLVSELDTSRRVYAGVDREYQRCVDAFEQQIDTSAIGDYKTDGRMFRMYTDRIQRRRGYAKAELENSKSN